MKHTLKLTLFLILMFVVTQFIGLYVVNSYMAEDQELPYGMTTPEIEQESDFYTSLLPSIIIAFVVAIGLLFILTRFKAEFILKLWFFIVIIIALGITLSAILRDVAPSFSNASLWLLILTVPLAFFKIYKRNLVVHNFTELFIYPGIAAVFVPILNVWTIIILLVIISIYDMWAVWHSGIMQKMAKYQINKLKIFGGFLVPYVSKEVRAKIKNMSKSQLKKKKIKVNMALLGGGDIIFPIITAGVVLKTSSVNLPFGLIPSFTFNGGLDPALLVVAGATLGLAYLFFNAKKKKFYPAMPFITAGMFLAMIIGYLVF